MSAETYSETLREAAEVLRRQIKYATVPPWEASIMDGLVWANRLGDPVSGSTLEADAIYIATMDPRVGTALASWLELSADRVDEYRDSRPYLDAVEGSPGLLIARLILGGTP